LSALFLPWVTQQLKEKKRKIYEEKEAFNSKWEEAYVCAEHGGKPQCLICLKVGVSEEYNVNGHYNTLHKEKKYDKHERAARLAMLCDLESKLSKQRSLFLKSATNERESLIGSYEARLELVKQKKKIFQRRGINQKLRDKNSECS
jgi:hypothetical protein